LVARGRLGIDGIAGASTTRHRLKDLDRPGRWVAAAFAVALLLAPVAAFARYAPDWTPSGDPALMGLRAFDVGTENTPLMGQPSLSGNYLQDHLVRHLGATHYYLLAPFVRLFGAAIGMLLVSLLIVGGSLLLTAWATFRQLGPAAGAVAAVVLGIITFTTGSASLVNPVSSNIAGYPFLCSMVLLWCLVCGDLRLLPLATALVSFTAQQHLSVLPTLAVATVAGVVGLFVATYRDEAWRARLSRQHPARWVVLSAGVGLALWLPVLLQEVFGDAPNLSQLAEFTVDDDRPTLGFDVAVRQVAHALGLPPLLGQRELTGQWLFTEVSLFTWLTAGLAVAVGVLAGLHWRRAHPRRSALVVMAAVLLLGGTLSGASVPEGLEQFRLTFYHWVFALAFFVTLGLGLAAGELMARLAGDRWARMRQALVGVAVVAVVVPSLANPLLDRWSNTLLAAYSPVERQVMDRLADDVMRHQDQFEGPVVLLARGVTWDAGIHEALALALNERGVALKHGGYDGAFVADDRLARRATIGTGLVLVLDTEGTEGTAGGAGSPPLDDPIADMQVPADFDRVAYETQAEPSTRPTRLRVFLLDRDELLDWATRRELPTETED
jgi:hypothetical protein